MKFKTQISAVILAATSLAVAMPAAAQGVRRQAASHGAHAAPFDIATLDADGDGKVTKAEIASARAAQTTALDANGDGMIDASELVAREMVAAEARAKAMIARYDVDADGMLSAAELLARAVRGTPALQDAMFDRIDTDGDGAISAEELDAAKALLRAHAGNRNGRAGDYRGRGGNAGARADAPFARHR